MEGLFPRETLLPIQEQLCDKISVKEDREARRFLILLCFKESILTPTTNACGVGPPSPSKGEGAMERIVF